MMEFPLDIPTFLNDVWLFMPRLAMAILIFIPFWLASRILRGIVRRFGVSKKLSPDITTMMVQVTEISLIIFGLVTALGTLGVNVAAIIAGLGLVGFALGFALKDLLSNLLAGFMILVYNPFVRGDSIQIGEHKGEVIEINMRYTVLQSPDRKVMIPNAKLFADPVTVHRQVPEPLPGRDAGEPAPVQSVQAD